jgi:transcriptional regulator with XRE-family HTH domain
MIKDNLARKMHEQGEGFRCSVLARKTGIPHETILQILKGGTKNPGIYTVAKLADALHCSVDELVGRQEFLTAISQKEKHLEYSKNLFCSIYEYITNFLEKNNAKVRSLNDMLFAINEIYEYSLNSEQAVMDLRFAEWFCENKLRLKDPIKATAS